MPDDVIGIVLSDIHLSHLPPKFRRAEPNWYAAMARTLGQVRSIVEEYSVPVICAGDIFDDGWRTHKCPPELLNFAIKYLPRMYAVPGQHDLPHHRYEDIMRSGYWTLVEAGIVKDIHPSSPVEVGPLVLHGFPWGAKLKPRQPTGDLATHVAVVHHYVWESEENGYHGAAREDHCTVLGVDVAGYDAVVFGDNHHGFSHGILYNCGGLFIRKSDEEEHKPAVGILRRDGTITRRPLDTSQDKYARDDGAVARDGVADVSGVRDFISEYKGLSSTPMFDLKQAFEAHYRKSPVCDAVRALITKAMAKP